MAQVFLLIAILGYYGWAQFKDIMMIKQWRIAQENLAKRGDSRIFRSADGIDVYGTRAGSLSSGVKRNVICLLRYESLASDLEMWRKVSATLGSDGQTKVIGYCDSQQCAESIKTMPTLPFIVLAYGEASSIQALVSADEKGNAIL
jgi:hypothetical protein